MNVKKTIAATFIGFIAAIIFSGITLRYQMVTQRQGFSGGDAFNFILTAEAFKELRYPKEERRLPFYPILLMPSSGDPLTALDTSKAIAFVAGSLTLIVIALLSYILTRSYLVVTIATFLSAFNVSLVVSSARPLADSVFTLLLTTSAYVVYRYWKTPTTQWGVITGITLGALTTTRFEGFIAMGLFFVLFTSSKKYMRKNLLYVLPIVILFMLPWLGRNMYYYGNPLVTQYAHTEGYGTDSSRSIQERMNDGYEYLNTLFFYWSTDSIKVTRDVLLLPDLSPREKLFIIRTQHWENLKATFLGLTVPVSFAVAVLWFLYNYHRYGLYLLASILGIFAVATWWQPRGRFYASQIPLLSMMYGLGLVILLERLRPRKLQIGTAVILVLLFAWLFGTMQTTVDSRIKLEARDSQDTAVLLQMLEYMHEQDAPAFTNLGGHLINKYYHQDTTYIESVDELTVELCPQGCLFFSDFPDDPHRLDTPHATFRKLRSFEKPLSQTYYVIYERL